MIRRPPRSTQSRSSAASDVYKRQDQHLVQADASAVAGAEALRAAHGVVHADALLGRRSKAELLPARVAEGLGLAAVRAESPHESLRDEAAPGRGHQVAGHAHLDEAIDGRRSVVGVQRAEHLVAAAWR